MIGRYVILRKIGQGGMGAVYEAEHSKLQKRVALKVLPQEFAKDPAAVARFEREMLAVGRVTHPGIVQAHDADEADGIRYLAMEMVDGYDVSEVVAIYESKTGKRLPLSVACEIVRQASVAIQAAHDAGLVHRDLKPSNLMLSFDGNIKVLDLGLAMLDTKHSDSDGLTATGQVMGTVDYMAPEQAAETRSVDARADVYSLGATLYRLIAGQAPYSNDRFSSVIQKLTALASADPTPLKELRPKCPDKLVNLVESAMAKKLDQRIGTAAELAAALQSASDSAKLAQLAAKLPKRKPVDRAALEATIDSAGEPGVAASMPGPTLPSATVSPTADTDNTAEVTFSVDSVQSKNNPLASLATSEFDTLNTGKKTDQLERTRKPSIPSWVWGLGVAVVALVVAIPWLSIGSPEPSIAPVESVIEKTPPPDRPRPLASNKTPKIAPPLAVAPFDESDANQHQQQWADYLDLPRVKMVDLPGDRQISLTLIPPGEYTRGSSDAETDKFLGWGTPAGLKDFSNEKPAHRVRLTSPFYLGTYEVTRGQFQSFLDTPSSDPEAGTRLPETGDNHPAVLISWNDATAYCEWLSGVSNFDIQLPTEAQWEFACRAGTTTAFYHGENISLVDKYCRGYGDANGAILPRRPDPVGSRLPNAFGLYDMLGNAMEWCSDWYQPGYSSGDLVTDPIGPDTGTLRVRRGGSWNFGVEGCRSASRYPGGIGYRSESIGFRVAIPIDLATGKLVESKIDVVQ